MDSSGSAMWSGPRYFRLPGLSFQAPKCRAQVDGECPIHSEVRTAYTLEGGWHSQWQTLLSLGPPPQPPCWRPSSVSGLFPLPLGAPPCPWLWPWGCLQLRLLSWATRMHPQPAQRCLLNSAKVAHATSIPDRQGRCSLAQVTTAPFLLQLRQKPWGCPGLFPFSFTSL